MFLGYNKYDPTISHELNMRRRDESQRQFYEATVKEDFNNRRLAEFEHRSIIKGKIAYVNMRMADLIQKNKIAMEGRRAALKKLYDAEFRAYQDAVKAAIPTEEDKIRAMEAEYASITQKNTTIKNQRVDLARERQWETNCDELRSAASMLNARACKLAWDVANCERVQKRQRDREEKAAWQKQVNDSHANFLKDEENRLAAEHERMMKNRQELEQQLTERERQKAEEAYQRALENEKWNENRRLGDEIDKLEREKQEQEKFYNQQQLLVRMHIENLQRAHNKEISRNDGKEMMAKIEAEMREQAERDRRNKENLRNEQLLYLEILRARKEKAMEEAKARDDYLMGLMLDAEKRLSQREQDDLQRRKHMAEDCKSFNYNRMNSGAEAREASKREKEAELAAALADLEAFEKEKLDELKRQYEEAKRFEEFLLMQTDEHKQRIQTEKDAEAEYQQRKKDEAAADMQRINARLGSLESKIREVNEVQFWDNERPRPKKQWYNV